MVSVIMSVYREPVKYLRQAIESIVNQTYDDIQFIIIVDDPNNKTGIDIVRQFAERDDRVEYYINSQNIGLTASLNKALKYVKGQYVARMDADDISETNRFQKQIEYLKKNNLDLIGSPIRMINENGDVIRSLVNPSYPPLIINKLIMLNNCIAHPTWFARKKVYDSLGGYREIYTCEDYDFLLRAIARNFRIGICDTITLNYRINTSGISRTNSLRQTLTANYITNKFYRINLIDQKEVERYLRSKITESSQKKYEQSVRLFSTSTELLKAKNPLSLVGILHSIIKSKYIIINIIRIAKKEIIIHKKS